MYSSDPPPPPMVSSCSVPNYKEIFLVWLLPSYKDEAIIRVAVTSPIVKNFSCLNADIHPNITYSCQNQTENSSYFFNVSLIYCESQKMGPFPFLLQTYSKLVWYYKYILAIVIYR